MVGGKHVLLGVTGGIAAYKSAFLIRELVKRSAEVQVIMTRAATKFITPLTLSTLSKRAAIMEMFPGSVEESGHQGTAHIDLALWADVMLIAPATANTIAKIVHGRADDFLTTLVLALRCPLVIAPAMDVDMYLNETTQENIATLKERGCFVIPPASGELASGLTGPGRLPEVDALLEFLEGVLSNAHRDLRGKNVLVTAGPTYEPIDPVRFIGNYSSGKMGFALANAATLRGANVTLVSGPVSLRTPRNVKRIDVHTACEMHEAVEAQFPAMDLVIMAAAVADYAPATVPKEKIKRDQQPEHALAIQLKQNPDILRSLGEKKSRQVLVGFALETTDGPQNALNKLVAKNLDAVILNDPTEEGAGFNTETNVVTVIKRDGSVEALPRLAKFDVANEILNRVLPLLT